MVVAEPSTPTQVAPEELVTRTGLPIHIRPIGPDDKGLLAGGFERLSPQSRYRRFFRPLDRLSQRDLAYLTEIDHHDHEALAAIEPETGHLIGVATVLLERLVERARFEGIAQFVALVMEDNTEALGLFEHRMPEGARPRRSASGHLELVIDLPEPGRVRDSALGRLLGTVAHGAVVMNPYRVMRDAIRRVRGE